MQVELAAFPEGQLSVGDLAVEVAPEGDEIVFVKQTSSVFNTTIANQVLRVLGVDTLVICGVATHACVEMAARDAGDLGYKVYVVSDCSASWSEHAHDDALRRMARGASGIVPRTSDEVIELIAQASQPVGA